MRPERAIYLRPSTASSWSKCAGFAALNAALRVRPDDADNDVREDGTACHWLAFEMWHGRQHAVGSMSPNKRELTDEMMMGVEDYHELLRSWPAAPVLEQTLVVSVAFPGVQDGTPDAYAIAGATLYMADLKFGFKPVEVFRLPQLIVYAWTLFVLYPQLKDAELTIVQPRVNHRGGPVRTWYVTREELLPLAQALQAMARAAHEDDPRCTVNNSCGNCAANGSCRTLAAAGGAGADLSYDAQPHELTPVELGYELTKLEAAAKHMEHRITGLTAQAESLIKSGKTIPGYDRQRAGTRYRLREDAVPIIVNIGRMLGVDVHAPPKLLSPAKLRDLFPALNVMGMYAEKPVGELRLKATDPNEALRAFTNRKKT